MCGLALVALVTAPQVARARPSGAEAGGGHAAAHARSDPAAAPADVAAAGEHEAAPAHGAAPAPLGPPHQAKAAEHGAPPAPGETPAHGEAAVHGAAPVHDEAAGHGAAPASGAAAHGEAAGHGETPAHGEAAAHPEAAAHGEGAAHPVPAPQPLPSSFSDGPCITVLALDTSQIMRLRDPERLAHAAVRLLAGLQRPGDQLAIVGFDEDARVLLPPTWSSPALDGEVLAVLSAAAYRGRGSRVSVGLGAAARVVLDGDPSLRERRVILLTVGGEDPLDGDLDGAVVERRRMLELVPELLSGRDTILHTVAFTRGADRALLEGLALRTGGAHRWALGPEALAPALAELVADRGARGRLAFDEDASTFAVDEAVESVVLTLDRSSGEITLVAPSGAVHPTAGQPWVRLDRPERGTWRVVQAPAALPPGLWVERGALVLGVRLDEHHATVDHRPQLGVFVAPTGQPPTRLTGLAVITDAFGVRRQVPLERRGMQSLEMAVTPRRAGRQTIELRIEVDGVTRLLTAEFGVTPSCLDHSVEAHAGQLEISARTATACPTARLLGAELVDSGGERHELHESHGAPGRSLALPLSSTPRTWSLEARLDVGGEVVTATRQPIEQIAITADHRQPWYVGLLWRLGVLNAPVGLVLAGLAVRARRARRSDP